MKSNSWKGNFYCENNSEKKQRTGTNNEAIMIKSKNFTRKNLIQEKQLLISIKQLFYFSSYKKEQKQHSLSIDIILTAIGKIEKEQKLLL